MKHVCEQLYKIGANGKVYGDEVGVCRITGKESMGRKLMRNVPVKPGTPGVLYGLRPSYWNPRHISLCKMPNDQ